jgi:hypothetical protein
MSATGPITTAGDAGYCQAPKLRERIGWQLWLGGGNWATITGVRVRGDDVLIETDAGTFRTRYTDAVRCRRPGGALIRESLDAARPSGSVMCDALPLGTSPPC